MSGRVYGSITVQLHCIGIAIRQYPMFDRMYLYQYSLGNKKFFHTSVFPQNSIEIPASKMTSCDKYINYWHLYNTSKAGGWHKIPGVDSYETA